MSEEERLIRLRSMLEGVYRVSPSDWRAPLFPRAKTQALLAMLAGVSVPLGDAGKRTLHRIEGAVWALGNYSFSDMEGQ